MRIVSILTTAQRCKPTKFYGAACDYPQESVEQITRCLLGIKGFTGKSAAFKQDCRTSFEMGRQQ